MVTIVMDKKAAPFRMDLAKHLKGADMRIKSISQRYFDFSEPSSLKVVETYRRKYQALSELLDENPRLLVLAHHDWARLLSSSNTGRRSRLTSEQLLRSLVVTFIEQLSYRNTVIRIDTSEFLRHFTRLGPGSTMDFSLLSKAFCFLSAETVAAMNQVLNAYAVSGGKISSEKHRLDTTVYEANIHYPTDSSLLWDSFRTLARLVRSIQKELPELDLLIGRNAASKKKATQRKVKQHYRVLIGRVRWIQRVGQGVLDQVASAGYESPDLAHYLPLVHQIVTQADQRVLQGIKRAADEKLYSLFEEHTELIQRGKAGKMIEFGHKILLAQTAEKFVHHYHVMARRREDKDLLEPALEAHKDLFGRYPELVAADKGFYESMKQIAILEGKIKTVSMGKKGRRNPQEQARERSAAFVEGQRFRAGVEGSISVLKRAFHLRRCLFKGFKNYAASVGLAVLCHNLVLLTRL